MSDSVTANSTPVSRQKFPAAQADNSNIKILIVDDNEASRYSIVRSLREAGFHVVEAGTGREALARVAECPDLVTLDVNLPDVHGFEVCKQIKSNPATAHIPVLHLSCTNVDANARASGLASGADGYLTEPIDRAELVATVNALLRMKTAQTHARQQAELAENARKELAVLNETLESRVQERTTQLQAANENLSELSARLLCMQDAERRRIARELHDSVGQLLAAIKMNNDAALRDNLPTHAHETLLQNSTMVDEILSSIRTISHLLHPPLLDEAGLPSALRWYVQEFSDRSGIRVSLHCDPSVGRFNGDLETAIFRIAQECLGNVHRHSQSATASVSLTVDEHEMAHLKIKDVGCGIAPERLRELTSDGRGGVGLRGLRERVSQLGGRLEIASTASAGTTVIAVLPCGASGETKRAGAEN
jgi:signal transduction histidine kinase